MICSNCGAESPAGKRFCAECGAPLGAAKPAPPEERRLVTALFCDLVGFTPLSERVDAEDVREIQAAYFSAMAGEVRRYGGSVEKYAGDAVLALFGAPVAHEDDPERAVLCALGMQQAMQPVAEAMRGRHGVELAIRVGVNTGEVVSGSWDAAGEQQVAVTGDVVNTAARLQAAAEPGGVLVGEETMRLARRRVRFGERQELSLKGKADPVAAYAAVGLRAWEAEQPTHATPLVGRQRELEAIVAAWTRAGGGEGQVLTVTGDAGVGKSRLAAEGIERIQPVRLLRGRCLSYGQSVSLWLVADLIRGLCSLGEDAAPAEVGERIDARVEELLSGSDATDRAIARDVLGEVLGLPVGESLVAQAGPQVRRNSLIRVLRLALESLSAREPLLVLLEDLHWLDTVSGEILDDLLAGLRTQKILVLATQRPGWTAPWSGRDRPQQLTLEPLDEEEAAALARAALGDVHLAAELDTHLQERTEGNPFFVEELVRYLLEIGGLEHRDGVARLRPGVAERLPATLAEVLLARLDRLEGHVKSVAQVGSVIGRSFAARLLARVMERDEELLADPLRSLHEADITQPHLDGELQHVFRHVLLRDAAYSMLLRKRQRELHLAVGRAIAALYPAEEYVEMIAYHYARTEEDAEAALWLERAGDRAAAAYANEAAISHYTSALERLEQAGADEVRTAGIEERLGEVLFRASRYEEARAVLERSLDRYERAGETEAMRSPSALLGRVLAWAGHREEARSLLEQTAAALDVHGPSTLAVRVQVYLANVFAAVGSYAEMLAAAERAAELARLTGDVRDRADAQERRGTALSLLGRVQESREALEEAAELAEAAGDLDALTVAVGNLGVSHDRAGEMVEALRLYQRALELARRSGFAQRELFSHVNVAAVLATTGEWAAAHEHLERAQEIAAVRGTASSVAAALPKHLGMLALKEGNWQEASQQLRRAAELAEGANWMDLAEAQESLAALAILEGRADEARDRLQGVVEHEAADLPSLLPTLAWAHLELGETERALELAQRAAREARERQALYSMPEALRVEGMALRRHGRLEEARAALTEGRERAAAMPKPYDEAGILVELALLERDEGDAAAARAHLEAALRIFRRLGAKKDVERAERELAARP